jgi:DNA-binding GntR family transcriptional regulator
MDPELYTAAHTTVHTATDTKPQTVSRGARGDRAYAELKRRLLLGEFPLRLRLGEERLAALLGVSRTPVRQALLRLHAERLIDRHPEGGFTPAAPDLTSIRQLYEVRRALELAAMRRPVEAGRRHDIVMLEPLRDDWRALSSAEPEPDPGFVLSDESFHLRLAEAAGNDALVEMLQLVNERIRSVRMHDFLTEERVHRTTVQHIGIVEAVLVDDLELALQRFEAHLGESMTVVEDRATRALARMLHGTATTQS